MNVITNIKLASPSEIDSIRTSWRNIPERVYRVAFSDNKVYLVYRIDEPKHVRVSRPWEAIKLGIGYTVGHYDEESPVAKAIKHFDHQEFLKGLKGDAKEAWEDILS